MISKLCFCCLFGLFLVSADAEETTNSIGMKLVHIQPGSFIMGQDGPASDYRMVQHPAKFDDADWDEKPAHKVTITQGFFMGATEVTLGQYRQFKPSFRPGKGNDDDAVNGITWEQAAAFCEWLSKKDGETYRLPTEAEWEYACRAGTTTLFNTGDALPEGFQPWFGDLKALDRFFPKISLPPPYRKGGRTDIRVAQGAPNAWGLYDMHGNVAEWCADWYGPYEAGDQTDPMGRAEGDFRVIRGGSHSEFVRLLRSANRAAWLPQTANDKTGFRVVRGPVAKGRMLPPPAPLLNAQNVSQSLAKIKAAPADAPVFEGPKPYVKIPAGSVGPLFATHNHSPTITECPNGDLLAVWYSCADEGGPELCNLASRLRCGSQEWEPASPFWDGVDVNDHAPKVWWDGDKTLYHFARGLEENIMRTSTDNGGTWSKASLIQPVGEFGNQVLRLKDGTLVLGNDARQVSLVWSRDGGKTWAFNEVAKGDGDFRPGGHGPRYPGIHAPMVQLADGRIMLVSRNDKPEDQAKFDGKTPASFTSDLGKTWTYEATPFPAISSVQRPAMIRLQEGPILLVSFTDQWRDWKNRKGMAFKAAKGEFNGYGMFAALSFDEGKTWPVRRLVTPGGAPRTINGIDKVQFEMSDTMAEPCGYLAATQARDGRIHLITSKNHYVFNLAWLKALPAVAMNEVAGPEVVVIGGTPGGIATAATAARLGHRVALVEYHGHLGGMSASGLGASDITNKAMIQGIFREFVDRIKAYYIEKYGVGSREVKLCQDGYWFEPSVAERIFDGLVSEQPLITVLKRHELEGAEVKEGCVVAVTVKDRDTGAKRTLKAKVFADATYEGDLIAAAGAEFRLGRESREEFGEPHAGHIYNVPGGARIGGTGEGDKRLPAFTFRIPLSSDPGNQVPLTAPPAGYDRTRYLGYFDDLKSGRFGNDLTKIAFTIRTLPHSKIELNMKPLPLGFVFAEENVGYIEAGWPERERITARLRDLSLGLLWFLQHDPEVPANAHATALTYQPCRDEFADNNHFPFQLYVREGRRLAGEFTLTERNITEQPGLPSERLHPDAVCVGEFPIDSFPMRKRQPGDTVVLEGYLGMLNKITRPYQIPYGVMIPKKVDGLIAPVPASTTHVAFSSVRLEPTWMALGQAAGIAAHLAVRDGVALRKVPVPEMQSLLRSQGAVLEIPGKAADPHLEIAGESKDKKVVPIVQPSFKKNVTLFNEPGRYGGWPANHGLWQWGDELVAGFEVAWFKHPVNDHAVDRSKPFEVWQARSLDGGKTWKNETDLPFREIGHEKTPVPLTEPLDFTGKDFALMFRFGGLHDGPSWFYVSNDRCHHWGGPYAFAVPGLEKICTRTDLIVLGPRDCLLFGSVAKKNDGKEGRVFCARTTDGGLNWKLVSLVGPEPEAGYAIMPSTVRLPGGALITTIRNGGGPLNTITAWRSDDLGGRWTALGDATPDIGSNPPALVLLKDGRLCLSYGVRRKPFGARARVSPDEGRTWGPEIMLRDDGFTGDLGYPRALVRPDGTVLTVYYFNGPRDEDRTIQGTFWRP